MPVWRRCVWRDLGFKTCHALWLPNCIIIDLNHAMQTLNYIYSKTTRQIPTLYRNSTIYNYLFLYFWLVCSVITPQLCRQHGWQQQSKFRVQLSTLHRRHFISVLFLLETNLCIFFADRLFSSLHHVGIQRANQFNQFSRFVQFRSTDL